MNVNFHLKIFSIDRRITISLKWIQYGIILATVLLAVASAYWGSMAILIFVVGVLGGIAIFLTLLNYPNMGFILIFLGGMFIPFTGPGGINISILTVILMLGLWLMEMFIVRRKFEFVKSRAIRPAFYMLLVSILSFAMGQIPWFVFANQAPLDAQIGGFAIYFCLVAAMIMTANVVRDVKWLKAIVWVFIGLGAAYVLGRTLQFPFINQLYQNGFYANSMFWMWMVALPLGQAIFNNHLTLRTRVLLYGLVALTFYVALAQQNDWKSGWVPAAVTATALIGLKFRKVIPFAFPFVLIVAAYLAQNLISTDVYSWSTRVDAWLVVLDISRVSPIIGLGFSNYYWYAKVFSIRGYSIKFNSHSQFVDIIAQTGILGLVCFMWILFEVGRLAWKLMDNLPDGFAKGYAYSVFAGVLGSLMAAFLVDWLLPFAYNIGLDGVRASILPWIFFGGLISLEQIYSVNQKTDPESLRDQRLKPVKA